VKVGTSKNNKV